MRKAYGLLPTITLCLPLGLALTACDKSEGEQAKAEAGDEADGAKAKDANDKANDKGGDKGGDKSGDEPKNKGGGGKKAVIEGGPVDITAILQKDKAAVYELLGEPSELGNDRKTCARFVPKLVRFECEVRNDYWIPGPGGLEQLVVEFEDGTATAVGMVGLVGEGDFTPQKGLEAAGLELPGEPFDQSAQAQNDTKVWDYFNPAARLVVGGKEHRVLVSIVEDDWRKSKVEVRVNHALTKEEEARVNFRQE